MNILIIGGAGYVGSHTVRHFQQNGYSCLVADNLVYGHTEAISGIPFFRADLLDKASLDNVFQKNKIDAVIHFAAFAYVGESVVNPQKYYENNVVGTLNLLEAMRKSGVNKIVFSSSCATYGTPQYTPIDETHPQNPINPYGRTKLMVEHIFEDYRQAYGLNYVALRYFNASGASADGTIGESHNPETHLIPLVFQAIRNKNQAIKVFGSDYNTPDGTCIRDYVHVEDLACAHRLALEKISSFSGCLNLGTGVGTSVKELIKEAEKIAGMSCPVEYVARRAGDPAILYASNTKAREILGWNPVYICIQDILKTVWTWEQNKRY